MRFPVDIEKNVLHIGNDINPDKQYIHIVYGVDDNYVKAAGVSIISILENNPSTYFVFHIITENISEDNLNSLKLLLTKYNDAIIKIHYINASIFDSLPTSEQFTKAIYNRFFLPKILRNETDKAIYIDADIICISSLQSLLDMTLNGIVCVVPDLEEFAACQQRRFKMKGKYWNSGFMYINIRKWEENEISEQALQYLNDNIDKLDFFDQDALNKVLDGRVNYLAKKYDYIFDIKKKQFRDAKDIPDDTVFIHYTGYKPWQAWYCHSVQEYFLRYYKLSPWKDIPLQLPRTYREMKEMSKGLWRIGRPFSSMYWCFKYIKEKVITKYL